MLYSPLNFRCVIVRDFAGGRLAIRRLPAALGDWRLATQLSAPARLPPVHPHPHPPPRPPSCAPQATHQRVTWELLAH